MCEYIANKNSIYVEKCIYILCKKKENEMNLLPVSPVVPTAGTDGGPLPMLFIAIT